MLSPGLGGGDGGGRSRAKQVTPHEGEDHLTRLISPFREVGRLARRVYRRVGGRRPQCQHLLITRYNVEADYAREASIDPLAPEWMAHRDTLFRRYCLASVQHQLHRDFEWFVIFHPQTAPVYFEFLPPAATPILARTTTDGLAIIRRDYIKSEIVVTTRIDNDDAVAADFMWRSRVAVEKALQGEFADGRDFIVSLTNGIVAHGPKGQWFRRSEPSPPFITMVENLTGDRPWISPLGINHMKARELYPMVTIDNGEPAWARIVHERNVNNQNLWHPGVGIHGALADDFPRTFPRYVP